MDLCYGPNITFEMWGFCLQRSPSGLWRLRTDSRSTCGRQNRRIDHKNLAVWLGIVRVQTSLIRQSATCARANANPLFRMGPSHVRIMPGARVSRFRSVPSGRWCRSRVTSAIRGKCNPIPSRLDQAGKLSFCGPLSARLRAPW